MNILKKLKKKIKKSFLKNNIPKQFKPIVRKTTKIYTHYQVDGIIHIAHQLKENPIKLTKNVIFHSDLKKMCSKVEFSHPGFINITLKTDWIQDQLEKSFKKPSLNIYKNPIKKTVVIDYSSPNIAKEMHVGHLRSTIIGDATANIIEFFGHSVIRINHIGDWGTQFGMIIAYLKNKKINFDSKKISLKNLELFYKKAKKKFNVEKKFSILSKKSVVLLQNNDPNIKKIWKKLVKITITENQKIYKKLNVSLSKKNIIGESFYKDMLPKITLDLIKKKIAIKKHGSVLVLLKNVKNKIGTEMGVIIKKSDGAFLYITIDIASLKYRYNFLHADRIIYCVDSRQKQHFQQVEKISQKAGYIPNNFKIEHHVFGMMLSDNNKPFKTRSGENIKLKTLINESIFRSKILIKKKNPSLLKKPLEKISKIIGIGAIKYADLSKNRELNYVFNWNNILRFDGNTALYIQYSYVRIFSIFKKNQIYKKNLKKNFLLKKEQDLSLGIHLLQFEETLYSSAKQGKPHLLCFYLYKLSSLFSKFYEKCPIFLEKNKNLKNSRLKLSWLTKITIKTGLNLLGIKTTNYL